MISLRRKPAQKAKDKAKNKVKEPAIEMTPDGFFKIESGKMSQVKTSSNINIESLHIPSNVIEFEKDCFICNGNP